MTDKARELTFSLAEYQARIGKVRRIMAEKELDLLLLHSLPSICYLTGFQTVALRAYSCLVLTLDDPPEIVTERDEQYNVWLSSWIENVSTYARWVDPVQVTIDAVRRSSGRRRRIGIESASRYLTPLQYLQLKDGLAPAALIDASDIVPSCMLIKSPDEIDAIRQAAAITVQGMQAAIDAVSAGRTDNDVAGVASQALIGNGSEYMSSDPIVCAGRNSAVPHGHYANRTIVDGDTVLLEMSACVRRYSAPLMRAVNLGKPDAVVTAMAGACRDALEGVIDEMRPGNTFAEAARRGKASITSVGQSMIFHGTYAYSIGLGFPGTSWADCPVEVRDGDPTRFEPGMVFHLPMSLRDKGKAGVAFSETVVITDKGCDVLTDLTREFFVKQ